MASLFCGPAPRLSMMVGVAERFARADPDRTSQIARNTAAPERCRAVTRLSAAERRFPEALSINASRRRFRSTLLSTAALP
jgi:hypothetical protein